MSQVITRAEVAAHNKKESGWFILNNGVYDVTKFYDDHPGGRDILLANIGTDATEAFEAVNHSRGALRKMADLQIGTLPAEEQRKFLCMKDVEAHKDASSCWFVISNKVYDVTPFLDNHPGGRDILLYNGGTDATQAFTDNGHSETAYKMLKDFFIGDLDVSERKHYVKSRKAGAAAEVPARRTGDESLFARIQEQLMMFMIIGLFIVAGYLCLS